MAQLHDACNKSRAGEATRPCTTFKDQELSPPLLCDIPSGCGFFTGPWTVTRPSLCMLRRVAGWLEHRAGGGRGVRVGLRLPLPRDALEGKGPRRPPQKRFDRRLEEVAKAVGGGYRWLPMPLTLALAISAFCRPLQPVLLLVSFPHSRSPVVGVPGLCWMWRDVPFVR